MNKIYALSLTAGVLAVSFASQNAFATCAEIKAAGNLKAIASVIVPADTKPNGGFGLPMWVTVVDETGKVCQVVNTVPELKDNNGFSNSVWLGSRVISAQKANTANAFSLDGFSISTANLYGLTQPGGSLYGLQHSNPVDASRSYAGSPSAYGTAKDPLINKRIGGVNVFGGGLALYAKHSHNDEEHITKIGAIGVSGDSSCTDHVVAWKIRHELGLDNVPGGFNSGSGAAIGDEMLIVSTVTPNTVQHPTCANPPSGLESGIMP